MVAFTQPTEVLFGDRLNKEEKIKIVLETGNLLTGDYFCSSIEMTE